MSNADIQNTNTEKANALNGGNIIVGSDPLYVSFIDETAIRSYPTKTWEYDFGDGIYYGLTEQERQSITNDFSRRNTVSAFELPGDELFFEEYAVSGNNWLDARAGTPQFVYTDAMNPAIRSGNARKEKYKTYPAANLTNKVRGRQHVTSYVVTSGSSSNYGNCETEFVDTSDSSYEYDERFKRPASATLAVAGQSPDNCGRYGNCMGNKSLKNTVGHLFKGPGVYTITFKQKPNSPVDYYGQLLAQDNFQKAGVEYVSKTVTVMPVCPCITIGLYDDLIPGSEYKYKPLSGEYGSSSNPAMLMHAALSSEEYSADDPENYGENDKYIDFNPRIFKMVSSAGEELFEGISGYAPYVFATIESNVKSNSFPVNKVKFYYDDWYTDFGDEVTEHTVTAYEIGWPLWKPLGDDGMYWDDVLKRSRFFSYHTFVMPGLYSVKATGEFDFQRIPDYWHDYIRNNCKMDVPKKYVVLVKEIMPKNPKITVTNTEETSSGSTFKTMKFDVTAGSFPLCNVVWDFDDGSEKLRLTRNTDGGYAPSSIEIEGTTATYIGRADFRKLVGGGTQYGALDASAGNKAATGQITSYVNGVYPEFDPRDWLVRHEFKRTSVLDKAQFMVSAMGYVCNTESLTYATYLTSAGEIDMPDFKETEGEVRLIDVRLKGKDDNVVMTLEGEGKDSTNLYNFEWEVK